MGMQQEEHYRKFLVIQTAFIGDVILALPVVSKLKRFYPNAQVDVLVRKGNEGLLANNPHVGKILILDKTSGKYKNVKKLIGQIRKDKYDAVVNIQRYFTTGLITAFSGARVRIGFDKNPLSAFFTRKVAHEKNHQPENSHEVNRNLYLIESLTDDSFEMPKMYPTDADFEKVKQDKPHYSLSPSSVWFTKQYPVAKWVELMDRLPADSRLVLLGGPGDKTFLDEIKEQSTHPDIVNLAGELSFNQSAALMKHARMNFVNDSAPLHLCSAMNAPVRAMFCSTVPAFGYTPLSNDSKVLEIDNNLPCRPCGSHGKRACPEGHFKCGEITVDRVLGSF
jgi:heptosyltransferase-2